MGSILSNRYLWISQAILLCCALNVSAAEDTPYQLQDVDIDEHRGQGITTELVFNNHQGEQVPLSSYFEDDKPVLVTLNYYECGSVCNVQLNRLAQSISQIDLDGDEFRIVTISIDPEEDVALAARTRETFLDVVGRTDIEWNFLVGDQEDITTITDEIGFRYRYDERTDQFAHLSALFFLSPEGQISQYLYGIDYPARDMKFALMEASEGRVGSQLDRILLSCFHYVNGEYTPFAMGVMRLGGTLTAITLAIFLFFYWKKERSKDETDNIEAIA
jgi:protein SCO1/2